MKLLVVDTAANICGVALTVGERLVSERTADFGRTLSARLIACIDELLRDGGLRVTDLDAIAVSLGPGSFTGVRIGVATVKGIAQASGVPVVGFSSLAHLAMNVPHAPVQVCPMLDARKKEVYAGLYRVGMLPEALQADTVAPPRRFLEGISGPTLFLGPGAAAYSEDILTVLGDDAIFAPFCADFPRPSAAAPLAAAEVRKQRYISPHLLIPAYIRASEAELARAKKVAG